MNIALQRILEPICQRSNDRIAYICSAEVTMLRISVVASDHMVYMGSLLVTTWWISAQNSTCSHPIYRPPRYKTLYTGADVT
jgi:hypothetical protein